MPFFFTLIRKPFTGMKVIDISYVLIRKLNIFVRALQILCLGVLQVDGVE